MDLSKSIDFLLENGGDVMKYRLHKEIIKDISKNEEENLLEKVIQTPKYRLLESYVKTMDILELVCTFGTSLKIPHCRMGRRRHVFYQIMVFQKMSRLLETLLRHCVMIKF